MRDARAAKDGLEDRIKAEDIKLAADIKNQTAGKCRDINASERYGIHEKVNEINNRTKEQLMGLEEKFNANKEKWVDDMFKHIIGG